MSESIAQPKSIQAKTLSFLQEFRAFTGARLLLLLLEQPGLPLGVMELSRRLYRPDLSQAKMEQLTQSSFRPVPVADKKAQGMYIQRCKALIARKASGDQDPRLDWELNWLRRELRAITRPRGGIKYSHPELDRAYHAFQAALWRLRVKALACDPEIFDYLRSHLRTGLNFLWIED